MIHFSPGERAHVNGDGAGAVEVAVDEEGIVVLTIRGCLDAAAGQTLTQVAEAAAAGPVNRLDIDLRWLGSFDVEGAAALVTCRGLTAGLPQGLHYRTGQGPGRQALLAAYAQEP